MGFEMGPQTVEYRDHVKIHGSGTEFDVVRGGGSQTRLESARWRTSGRGAKRWLKNTKGRVCASNM